MLNIRNRKTLERILLLITIILIIGKVVFYFQIFDIVHPPDSGYHNYVLGVFKDYPFTLFLFGKEKLDIICSSFAYTRTGLMITSSTLYGAFTGSVAFLLDWLLNNETLSLKLTNLVQTSFGLLNIYFVYKLSGFVLKDRIPRIFVILILANIQMFSYLMNFLSYDNLTNLASTASIYYLTKYIKEKGVRELFLLFIFLCIGILTKYTFAVLFVLIVIFLFVVSRKRIRRILLDIKDYILKKENIVFTLLTVFFLFITLFFHIKLFISYDTVIPNGDKGNEYCLDVIEEMEEGEYTITGIPADAIWEDANEEKVGFLEFSYRWFDIMVERSINVTSHKSLYKPIIFNQIFEAIFLLSFVIFLFKKYFKNPTLQMLVYLFMGYLLYLLFYKYYYYVNFEEHTISNAVAGRYLFPVIAPFVIIFVYSFWNIFKNKTISIIILSILSLFFIYSDTIYLFQNYKVWSVAYTQETNGTVDPIFPGQSSLKQKFQIEQEYANNEIGIYFATYAKDIKDGYVFNLYEGDCLTNIEAIDIKRIRDNSYTLIEFENDLEYEKTYCFDIENTGNELPITLWYSSNDIEGSVITVLLESKDQTSGLVGPIYEGKSSPKQKFYLDEEYSKDELGIFASTYAQKIEGGYLFNLYDEACTNKIDSIEIDSIWDNDYFIVNFENDLEYNKTYCFEVVNLNNEFPITLWYSSLDLNGGLLEQENIDLHYSQIKRFEDEKDILYSPVRKYGF